MNMSSDILSLQKGFCHKFTDSFVGVRETAFEKKSEPVMHS